MAKRNRKIRIFETSIEKLARILAKKWKIKVVFKHGECSTNGSTIFLPTLPDNADKELMDAMQGHLDHEAAHVVFTDFSTLTKHRRFPKMVTVVNALEDLRIEDRWIQMYPGAKLNLKRSAEWSLQRICEKQEMVDPEDGQKKEMMPWDGLSKLGKFLHGGITWVTQGYDDTHWFIRDILEPEILADLHKNRDLFEQSIKVKKTPELVDIATEMLKRLAEDNTEEEVIDDPNDIPDDAIMAPPGASGSPQDKAMHKQPKDQGGPPVVEMDPSMSADPQEGEGGEQEGTMSAGEEETQQDQGQQSQPQQGGCSGNYDIDETGPGAQEQDSKLTDRSEQLKEAATGALSNEDRYMVYSTEGDILERVKEGDRILYKRFMTEAMRYVAPMKRKMARSLLSTAQSRWEGDKTRGKINPRKLYQVSLGTSKRVFRQKVEAEDFDTAVLLMVDHSGSMNGRKLDLAAKTAIVLGELLNQLNIPFSVLGFSTCSNHGVSNERQQQATQQEKNLYTRWGNLWIGEYKGFSDSWNSAGQRMITMASNCQANTYDGESLKYGAQVLLGRPEKRKIMFWLNDGEPCPTWGDDGAAHVRYAKDAAAEVEKMIELFAIGISTDAVKKYYKNCVRVNQLEDLPKTVLQELDGLVRKGKSYHSNKAA